MAEDLDGQIVDAEDSVKTKRPAKHDTGAYELEKVTDYVEEQEIVDKKISEAIKLVSAVDAAQDAAESELAKVKINRADVDLIVAEMDVPRALAERTLKQHRGDVVKALCALVAS